MKPVKVEYLNEAFVVDAAFLYFFLTKITTPFEKWKAYKTGVIDENGTVLVKKKDRTPEQKKSWSLFDVFVRNIKRLLIKLPFGRTRVASFAAALFLLKEEKKANMYISNDQLLENKLSEFLEVCLESEDFVKLVEEIPANNIGSGNIAMYTPVLRLKRRKFKDELTQTKIYNKLKKK